MKNRLISIISLAIIFLGGLIFVVNSFQKISNLKSGGKEGVIIDVLASEGIVVTNIDNKEIRFSSKEINLNDLNPGTIVKINGQYKDQELIKVDEVIILETPKLTIQSHKNNDKVTTDFSIMGTAEKSGNKVGLVLVNKRTKEILLDQEAPLKVINNSNVGEYIFNVSLSLVEFDLHGNEELEATVNLYKDDKKLSSKKVNLVLFVPDIMRKIEIFYPKENDSSCRNVQSIRVELNDKNYVNQIKTLLYEIPEEATKRGLKTYFNSKIKIKNISVKDGLVIIDFDKVIEQQLKSECQIYSIYNQLKMTFGQFSEINEVMVTVDGDENNIFTNSSTFY